MLHVVQRARGRHDVERGALEGQRHRVAFDQLDVGRSPLASFGEQLGDDVDAHDLTDVRRQRERERAGARADIQCPLLAAQRQEAAEPFLRLCGAPILVRRDELGRLGEAPPYLSGLVPAIQMITRVNSPSALTSKKLQLCMSFFVPSTSSPT